MRDSLRVVLTWGAGGYCARIGNEYIQLPKVPKHALHSGPHALEVELVRSKHEHVRARHGSNDYVPRLAQGTLGAHGDRNRSVRTAARSHRLAPNNASRQETRTTFPLWDRTAYSGLGSMAGYRLVWGQGEL